METTFNPYQIFWGVIELQNNPTQNQAKSLNTASVTGSASKDRNFFFFHAPANLLDERKERVLAQLMAGNLNGTLTIITDKQYGMIANDWRGNVPETPKPFINSIVLRNGTAVMVVPVSEEQLKNAINF